MYQLYIEMVGKQDNKVNLTYYNEHKQAIDELLNKHIKPTKNKIKELEKTLRPTLTAEELKEIVIDEQTDNFKHYLRDCHNKFEHIFSNEKIKMLDDSIDKFYSNYHMIFNQFEFTKYKRDLQVSYHRRYKIISFISDEVFKKVFDEPFKQWKKEHSIIECLGLLKNNPHYADNYEDIYKQITTLANLKKEILNAIPDNYINLYPEARIMKRKFVLHIGPTNSGKTYDAIESLKTANNGVYLAPLRLLAYEQFDNLNKQGVICSLLTGEEVIDVPFSTHIASTIEMASLSDEYDVAVIDEGQMLDDYDRGNAWTRAIIGLKAKEIHICAANYAKDLIIKLINECNDNYEIFYNERKTPLKMDFRNFDFPSKIEKGDALIVFSRKSVHGVANELKKKNIKCSIIYGALPYDVRHKEAEKFANGETDVLVATDAIGVGLNLPIQRIIFLEDKKFDGIDFRNLYPEEIQQIAGRAGRYGIYNVGFVNSYNNSYIKKSLNATITPLTYSYISFAPSLIGLDVKLSKIISKWQEIKTSNNLFIKTDTQRMIELCKFLEGKTDKQDYLTKKKIYDLITIPFDDKLLNLWQEIAVKILFDNTIDLNNKLPSCKHRDMETLELAYKKCDLLHNFAYKFNIKDFDNKAFLKTVFERKRAISEKIIELLEKRSYAGKRCSECGCELSWEYPYKMCNNCYQAQRAFYRYNNFYW